VIDQTTRVAGHRVHRRASVAIAVLGVLILVAGGLTAFGWSAWPVIVLSASAFLLAVASRVGYLLAASLTVLVVPALVLLALLIAAAVWFEILPTIGVSFAALGFVGCGVLARSPLQRLRIIRSAGWDIAASCLGVAAWLTALAVSARVPLAERLGWVMRNDSMNNLIYAHYILRAHGIQLRPDLNPTPLPAAMIALGIVSGRPSSSPELSLQHDLIGTAVIWFMLIALVSVVMGLTAAVIVRTLIGSGIASHLAAAGGSVLVFSWFVTGYPIEYGFLNIDLVVPILLAVLLLTVFSDRVPWLSLSGQLLAATLMLATWSPLVVVPLALFAVTVIRRRATVLHAGRLGRVLMIVAALQFAAYGIFGTLPAYLAQKSALSGLGGIYSHNYLLVFPAGAAVIGLGFLVFRRDLSRFIAVSTLVLASWLALALLLFISRRNSTPWTYYPIKIAFFSMVVFIAPILGLAVVFLAQHSRRRVLVGIGSSILVALGVGLLVFVPPIDTGLVRMNPIARLVSSHPSERYVLPGKLIQALARTGSPAILWDSETKDEPYTDLWLLQLRADTLSGTSKLRLAAYNQLVNHSTRSLCEILTLTGPSTVIYTRNMSLPAELAELCPRVSARVEIPPSSID
jgi:hypothetical protein